MSQSNHIELSIKAIEEQQHVVEMEQEKKVHIMEEFLAPIEANINFYNHLWEQQKDIVETKFKQLAQDLNFTYSRSSSDELNLDSIMKKIISSLPLHNYEGVHAFEDLPSINETWQFEYDIQDGFIILEVIPDDPHARYPIDPENNPYQFTYLLPVEVHEQSLVANEREKVLTDYFNSVVNLVFIYVTDQIQDRLSIVKQLDSIDLTNPNLIAELKKRFT